MKNFNIVLVVVSTLISTGVLAQANNTTSKKEQLKIEVLKINTTPAKINSNVTAINRSAKEQMKIDLLKPVTTEQSHELVFDDLGNCSNQLTYSNRSAKEQMKMKVVKQYKCMVVSDTASVQYGKCTLCGKNATIGKK